MTNRFMTKPPSRRQFLSGAAGAGVVGAAVATSAASDGGTQGDPLITQVQDWAIGHGDGVDITPYGLPIDFESDVVRRNVGWLTADMVCVNGHNCE